MFGVMRHAKRNNRGAISGIQKEANRQIEEYKKGEDFKASMINWENTKNNEYVLKSEDWLEDIDKKISEYGVKTRKNSVLCFDSVYSASPEFWETATKEEQENYKQACYDWHIKHMCQGDANRLVSCVWHYDEKTPHAHFCTVPIVKKENGKMALSADVVLGGRKQLSEQQQSFEDEVCKKFGFEPRKIKTGELLADHLQCMEYYIAQQKEQLEELKAQEKVAKVIDSTLKGVEPLKGKKQMLGGNSSVNTEELEKHNRELENIATKKDIEDLKNLLSEPEKIKQLSKENFDLLIENKQLEKELKRLIRLLQEKEDLIKFMGKYKEGQQLLKLFIQEQGKNKEPRRRHEQEK